MSGFIYFLKDNDKLIPMEERTYDSELLLQSLLENYPTLLAGEQIDTVVPRKWVLISREKGVPDTAKRYTYPRRGKKEFKHANTTRNRRSDA
jgi:hypothetical protein